MVHLQKSLKETKLSKHWHSQSWSVGRSRALPDFSRFSRKTRYGFIDTFGTFTANPAFRGAPPRWPCIMRLWVAKDPPLPGRESVLFGNTCCGQWARWCSVFRAKKTLGTENRKPRIDNWPATMKMVKRTLLCCCVHRNSEAETFHAQGFEPGYGDPWVESKFWVNFEWVSREFRVSFEF